MQFFSKQQLFVLFLVFGVFACQAIVSDYGEAPITNESGGTDTDRHTDDDFNTDTYRDTDTESNTDDSIDTNSTTAERDACLESGMYWYDAEDVNQNTVEGFAALVPSCRDKEDEGCPDSGKVIWAHANEEFLSDDIGKEELSYYNWGIDNVYSTIRCMKNLKTVWIGGNSFPSIDFANNRRIESFYSEDNSELAYIGMPYTDSLRELYVSNTKVTDIDLTNATQLYYLGIVSPSGRGLTKINLQGLKQLRYLNLSDNRIDNDLDLSESEYLEEIDISLNPIQNLILPKTSTLTNILVYGTALNTLDLTGITDISDLNIWGTSISVLNLADSIGKIRNLIVSETPIVALDLADASSLIFLELWNTQSLTSLVLPEAPSALETLYAHESNISSIDLTSSTSLQSIRLSHANFTPGSTKLEFSHMPYLRDLYCMSCSIDYPVDLSANENLEVVDLSSNYISEIFLPDTSPWLSYLHLVNNRIEKISLGTCESLVELGLESNRLNYAGSGDDGFLDLTQCELLEIVNLNDNLRYTLSFKEGQTFPDAFLENPQARLYIEQEKWDANNDSRKPDWVYSTEGYFSQR